VCLKAGKTASRDRKTAEPQEKTASIDEKIASQNSTHQKHRVFPQPVQPLGYAFVEASIGRSLNLF
jgi:hypothetical protein